MWEYGGADRETTTCIKLSNLSVCVVFFFFSSRRRHTRCSRDWSSDVCSSDLRAPLPASAARAVPRLNSIAPPRTSDRLPALAQSTSARPRVVAGSYARLPACSIGRLPRRWASAPAFSLPLFCPVPCLERPAYQSPRKNTQARQRRAPFHAELLSRSKSSSSSRRIPQCVQDSSRPRPLKFSRLLPARSTYFIFLIFSFTFRSEERRVGKE